MPLTVRDIMDSAPATVRPEDPVADVLAVLSEHEVHGVPVVTDGGRCVGIVTEADLVLVGEQQDLHLPHYVELFGGLVFLESHKHFEERLRKAVAATAKDMMTPDPVTVSPDATVDEAAQLIARTRHNRLPVVEHGRLVGVVTRLDLLAALTRS